MEKRCFKCRKTKPVESFYPHKQMKDGRLNKCKNCTKKDVRRRYYDPESRERIREYERRRFKSPERKAKILEYQRARRTKFPGKERARARVRQAIKRGDLIRMPCEICGAARTEAHHTDYRKPLEVRWLCFVHHRKEHGQRMRGLA